jgi:hypothetical protein
VLLSGALATLVVGAGLGGYVIGRRSTMHSRLTSGGSPSPSSSSTAELSACFTIKNRFQTIVTEAQNLAKSIVPVAGGYPGDVATSAAQLTLYQVTVEGTEAPASLRVGRELLLRALEEERSFFEDAAAAAPLLNAGQTPPAEAQARAASALAHKAEADQLLESARNEFSQAPCSSP